MKPIEVKKDTLLDKMRENRRKHEIESDDALTGWRERIQLEMNNVAAQISVGDTPDKLTFDQPPKSFLTEYDTAIDMLEWDEGIYVELSRDDFNRFVRDEWAWTELFKQSYASNDVNALRRARS
jgi:hypothetical protein